MRFIFVLADAKIPPQKFRSSASPCSGRGRVGNWTCSSSSAADLDGDEHRDEKVDQCESNTRSEIARVAAQLSANDDQSE